MASSSPVEVVVEVLVAVVVLVVTVLDRRGKTDLKAMLPLSIDRSYGDYKASTVRLPVYRGRRGDDSAQLGASKLPLRKSLPRNRMIRARYGNADSQLAWKV